MQARGRARFLALEEYVEGLQWRSEGSLPYSLPPGGVSGALSQCSGGAPFSPIALWAHVQDVKGEQLLRMCVKVLRMSGRAL